MKSLIKFFLLFIPFLGFAQTEILIVGTAHDVPEGMEFNYQPILDITTEWNPDVICTEYRKPDDTLSLTNIYGIDIFQKMDSIAQSWNIAEIDKQKEIATLYKKLERREDLHLRMQLRNLLYVTLDRGNAYFQSYLIDKAVRKMSEEDQNNFKSKYPMYEDIENYVKISARDEYTLAGFPLAEKLGIDYLFATDDQTLSTPYHDAWNKSIQELEGTPQLAKIKNLIAGFRKTSKEKMEKGTAVLKFNTYEMQEKLYEVEYSGIEFGINEQADLMSFYWGERNERMTQHILDIADKNPNKKIVVFYGSSHVPAVRRKLKANSNYKILTLPDLKIWNKYESLLK